MSLTTYRFKASEIDQNFLEELKQKYGDQEIEIIVTEMSETDYLFTSEANKKRLLSALKSVEKRENLVQVSLEELE